MSEDARILGQYLPAAPAVPANALSPLRVDADSVLLVRDMGAVPPAPTILNQSMGSDAWRVLSNFETHLYSFTGYNASAAIRYLMLFEQAFLPANGSVPFYPPIECLPFSNFSVTFEPLAWGIRMNGCMWAASSTPNALTVIATPDIFAAVVWDS